MRNQAVYSDPLIQAELSRHLKALGYQNLVSAQLAFGLAADGVLGPNSFAKICETTEAEVLGRQLMNYVEEKITVNHRDQRRLPVKLIVMHWTAGGSFQGIIDWFLNPAAQVSAHYLIGTDGDICRQVLENNVAWHAGAASLGNYGTSINDCSIGIEMCGPPSMVGLNCWPTKLLEAAVVLCKDIQTRFPNIKLTDHSTILPLQKTDVKKGTGADLFPWDWFVKRTGIPEAHPDDKV